MGKKTIKSLAQGKYQGNNNNNGGSNKQESIDPNQYLIQNESRSSIHSRGSDKFEDVVLGQENSAANDKSDNNVKSNKTNKSGNMEKKKR